MFSEKSCIGKNAYNCHWYVLYVACLKKNVSILNAKCDMALHPYSTACARLYQHLEYNFTLAITQVTVFLLCSYITVFLHYWLLDSSPFSAHATRSRIKQILSNEILIQFLSRQNYFFFLHGQSWDIDYSTQLWNEK